jgi:hypothetical protein
LVQLKGHRGEPLPKNLISLGLYVYNFSVISTSLWHISRLLFMAGTGFLVVGFSFAMDNGCTAKPSNPKF